MVGSSELKQKSKKRECTESPPDIYPCALVIIHVPIRPHLKGLNNYQARVVKQLTRVLALLCWWLQARGYGP